MSVATVKTRLATIEGNISGIRVAYAQGPNSLVAANLPAFINLTRPGQVDWRAVGSDDGLETRLYLPTLYVRPFGTGIPGEGERDCEPFFALVRDAFAARPSLEQLIGVQEAIFLGDGGVTVLRYPIQSDSLFWGIEFRLQVREIVARNYADYE